MLLIAHYEDLWILELALNISSSRRNLSCINALLSSNCFMLGKCLNDMFKRGTQLLSNQVNCEQVV